MFTFVHSLIVIFGYRIFVSPLIFFALCVPLFHFHFYTARVAYEKWTFQLFRWPRRHSSSILTFFLMFFSVSFHILSVLRCVCVCTNFTCCSKLWARTGHHRQKENTSFTMSTMDICQLSSKRREKRTNETMNGSSWSELVCAKWMANKSNYRLLNKRKETRIKLNRAHCTHTFFQQQKKLI